MWAAESVSAGAVAVASIPAAIGFVGLFVGTWLNNRQTTQRWERETAERADAWAAEREDRERAREHEHTIERNRVLRAERLALYRRLVDSATAALLTTMTARVRPTDDEVEHAHKTGAPWQSAFAEALLIAPAAVVGAAMRIDEVRRDRYMTAMSDSVFRSPQADATRQAMADYLTPNEQQQMTLLDQLSGEGEQLLGDLIAACRADVEHMS